MKKLLASVAIIATILLLGGCDLFRKMAGRPTAAEIEAKRGMILGEQKAHKARLDSLNAVQKQISDSLAALDSLKYSGNNLIEGRQLSAESRAGLEYRYYVVIGAFGKSENAEKLAGKAEAAGYPATLIRYLNGFVAVGICPSNSISGIYASLRRVQKESFCPADSWILDNK